MNPNPSVVVNAFNPWIQELEAVGWRVWGQSGIQGSESCGMDDTKNIVGLGVGKGPSILFKHSYS